MIKVPDLPYKRCAIEDLKKDFDGIMKALSQAKSAEEVLKVRDAYLDVSSRVTTAVALAEMRFTLNITDEFYLGERMYYDSVMPEIEDLSVKYADAMLACPFRDELVKSGKINPIVFKQYEMAKKAHDERNIEDSVKENAVVTEYAQLMAGLTGELDGKELPLPVLRARLLDGDRNARKRAAEAIGKTLGAVGEQLDDIYDRLVKIRTRMARRLGLRSFTDLGYYRMMRTDYDRGMVEKFRANVLKDVVPAVTALKKRAADRMGIDNFMFYDDGVYGTAGDEKPVLDKDGIFRAAQEMYDEMDGEIGNWMRTMQETDAFDVVSRKNKWGGGYCTAFPDFKQTFILANFSGSSGDIDVITHEFGHSYAMGQAFACGDRELDIGPCETAECHSMSMEFLAWKYIDRFFKNGNAYRYKHVCDSLSFIPYGVIVDEFQHRVYDEPELTPAQRNEVWLELERKYRPHLSYDGIEYLEKGTRWQFQMHIYENPFYYIDYCLAQTIALSFLSLSLKDYGDALARYKAFCKTGGRKPFSGLVRDAGFPSPFAEGSLRALAADIGGIIKSLE